MRTVILVPRRAGIPERDAIWEWCRARWEELLPDIPIFEGHHDAGPFNRSAALNEAARLAGDWDLAIVVDADILISPVNVREAIAVAAETGHVTWAFGWWAGLTQQATEAILAGKRDADDLVDELAELHAAGEPNALGHVPVPAVVPPGVEKINPVSWSCCFVVPRAAWERLDGFDERFAGWGWEDMAFQAAAVGLIGHERLPGAVVHLWHPRAPGLGQDGVNKRRNRQLGRRYMVALRERGLHDRPAPSDPEEMERDRQHIRRLATTEETTRGGKPAPDLPDWRDWWPPLEELIESWRERRTPGPGPRISLVVRSGGPAATWPARKAYLEQALESFDRHVTGEFVRKVVFSDWPGEVRPELDEIAQRHGLYVVGEGNAGFTTSMQNLWRYIASRKDPFDYVFLLEDDFVFERDVDLGDLVAVLADRPYLAQMALLRDACYQAERDAGGILGHPVEEFRSERSNGYSWLEHRRFWTLNPTLFRRSLTETPWPGQQHSEAVFGRILFRGDRNARSGLWGEGEAWIRHVGEVRAGSGY